jgi:hypothetical protein
MSFKFKQLVASVALALAAGGANAAISTGDLVLVLDKETSSASFDLGLNLAAFTATSAQATGGSITWNFVNNTVTTSGVTGYTGVATGSWSSAWSSISGAAGTGTFGVLGMDDVNTKFVSTSSSSNTLTLSTTDQAVADAAGSGVPAYLSALNAFGTHGTAAAGAGFVNDSLSGALHNNGFGTADAWGDTVPFSALGAGSSSLGFWQFDAFAAPVAKKFQGAFSLNGAAGTLTYSVAAVPEPSTYALLAAGMAVIGVFARRRRA